MPAFYNQPAIFGNAVTEDVNKFSQLPFYLVKNEVKAFQDANVFDQLYGKIAWQANQGDTMKGVTPQRSPVGSPFFFPNAISTVANKDIYTVTESQETAVVRAHKFESFQFNFIPSFQVFWDTYLQFQNKDIADKIALRNNQFIETNMWFNAENVYLCGTGLIGGCPIGMGNSTGDAAGSKTYAWLTALVQGTGGNAGVQQNLRLRDLYNAVMNLQIDLAAPSFSGVRNIQKDNEGIKGKYVLVTSAEQWLNFTYDPDVSTLKSIQLDLLFNDFKGSLFGTLTVKCIPYPIRFSPVDIKDGAGTVLWKAGQPIDPEIYNDTTKKWNPNPYYTSLVSAPYEVAWMLGDSYAKTIKVGPPPKEFAAQNMSGNKFYKMQWNGEIQLTDQFLITDANGNLSLNTYGEQLKFQSKLTFGYLVGERRYAFPMILRRSRPARMVA